MMTIRTSSSIIRFTLLLACAAGSTVPSNNNHTSSGVAKSARDVSSNANENVAKVTSSCTDDEDDQTNCSAALKDGSTDHYYCVDTSINKDYELLGNQDCFYDDLQAKEKQAPPVGDFVSPDLQPGHITPILWRRSSSTTSPQLGGKIFSQNAFQFGLPPQLAPALIDYANSTGILTKLKELTTTSPVPYPNTGNETIDNFCGGQLVSFDYNPTNLWHAERPAKRWNSNMHWILPATEQTHEEFLAVLFSSGLQPLLESIGKALQLDSLVMYSLAFIGVSKAFNGIPHSDTSGTGKRTYQVIIPLMLEEDVDSELLLWDDDEETTGGYKYKMGTGLLLGDGAIHATRECDYTIPRDDESEWKLGGNLKGQKCGLRLAATVYIADINDENVKDIAKWTLTNIFPLADLNWLFAQRGRHWVREYEVEENEERTDELGSSSSDFVDQGRKRLWFGDRLPDCPTRASQGMCESDKNETRKKCVKSCRIYIENGVTSTNKLDNYDGGAATTMYRVCTQNRMAVETCQNYHDDTDVDGDFVVPTKKLEEGEMFPFVWRDDGSHAAEYAFRIGLPSELSAELLNYCNELGITNLFRDWDGDHPIETVSEEGGKKSDQFVTLADKNRWHVHRPLNNEEWSSKYVSPADEKTHEEVLKILSKGNFDAVLEGVGKFLGLEALVAYQLAFFAVSDSEKGFIHRDSHATGASVYNVIIPLILDDDSSSPELELVNQGSTDRRGSLKYQLETGYMMGDDVVYGYRERKGIHMAASIYIADLNYANYRGVMESTLGRQVFPQADKDWLLAQRGRHYGYGSSLKTDEGRARISFFDHFLDCKERAKEGLCESDLVETRKKCPRSCNIYERYRGRDDELWYTDMFIPGEEYFEGKYLNPFFDTHGDDSCVDESDECVDDKMKGLCLTNPDHMREIGCHRSCLFCVALDSRELFSMGETQVLQSDDEDANEKAPPNPDEVLEVLVKTEQYLANKVLVESDHEYLRLSCRNYNKKCAIWSAQGYCDEERDYMGKYCAAACQDCEMLN